MYQCQAGCGNFSLCRSCDPLLLNRPWQPAFTREHQRQAVRLLRDLRQEVGRPQLPLQAQEDPQRRQAPQVPLLHQEVYPEVNQLQQVHS